MTVARADVDHDAAAGGQSVELTDVDLGDAAADEDAHSAMLREGSNGDDGTGYVWHRDARIPALNRRDHDDELR